MSNLTPLSQREFKLATSLHKKKYRDQEQLFIAEGEKVVTDLLRHFTPRLLLTDNQALVTTNKLPWREATADQLRKVSLLDQPTKILGLFEQRKSTILPHPLPHLTLALDAVQNPGNLGTIIRLCDWLGISHILLGKGSVDLYNPKVVQATAGALGNVSVLEQVDLSTFLPKHFTNIIATAMDGRPYLQIRELPTGSLLLLGNEGHGIAKDLLALAHETISVPPHPATVSESLNVALSAAVLLSKLVTL